MLYGGSRLSQTTHLSDKYRLESPARNGGALSAYYLRLLSVSYEKILDVSGFQYWYPGAASFFSAVYFVLVC